MFRLDAGGEIGDGHAMRCFSLAYSAQALGFECCLLVSCHNSELPRSIQYWVDHKIIVSRLSHSLSSGSSFDGKETIAFIEKNNIDWLVVDGYQFSAEFWHQVSGAKCKKLRFDDMATEDYSADIVVNQNPGAEINFLNSYSKVNKKLLGLKYANIRSDIKDIKLEGGNSILICLGGNADAELSYNIAKRIRDAGIKQLIQIIAENIPNNNEEIKGVHFFKPTDLSCFFKACGIVVCGGGVTAIECLYLKLPTVMLSLADNQLAGANYLSKYKNMCLANSIDEIPSLIKVFCSKKQAQCYENALYVPDGKGSERIIKSIEKQ